MRNFECTLATTTSTRASSSSEPSSAPSSRMSTSTPVRMRNGAISSFSSATTSSCSRSRSGGQAVGDREPRRVVGEREVLVAERPRLLGHRRGSCRRRRTSRSATCRSPLSCARNASPRLGAGRLRVLEQLLEVLRRLARPAPPRSRPRSCRRSPGRSFSRPASARNCNSDSGHPRDLARGPPEGLLAVRRCASPHQEVGDALECLDGRHAPTVPSRDGVLRRTGASPVDRPDARQRRVREVAPGGLRGRCTATSSRSVSAPG